MKYTKINFEEGLERWLEEKEGIVKTCFPDCDRETLSDYLANLRKEKVRDYIKAKNLMFFVNPLLAIFFTVVVFYLSNYLKSASEYGSTLAIFMLILIIPSFLLVFISNIVDYIKIFSKYSNYDGENTVRKDFIVSRTKRDWSYFSESYLAKIENKNLFDKSKENGKGLTQSQEI